MAQWSVIWTSTAINQRRQILKYWTIRNKSTTYAKKLIKLINERISIIVQHPSLGKSTNHSNTKQAAMGNFSIYYKIDENQNQIFITAFWDNRQNPENLLHLSEE